MQTMCLESWFLGNREVFPKIYSENFKPYVTYFDVSKEDPERMTPPEGEGSIGGYSKQYLKKMMNETGKTYSVSNVNHVTTIKYIQEIDQRLKETGHINSYHYFKDFMESL